MGDVGNAINRVLSESENKTKKVLTGRTGEAIAEISGDIASAGNRNVAGEFIDSVTGKKGAEAANQAADAIEEADKKVKEDLVKNEEVAANTLEAAKARARQKKMAAKKSGRAGTILTSPLGNVSQGDQPTKTLLGQ